MTMAGIKYLDFDLLIEGSEEGYCAGVLNSPAGQASANFSLPFLEGGGRGPEKLDIEPVKTFGERLFEAVFVDQVQSCLRRSLDEAKRQQCTGLRIRLRLTDVPELASLPWEYLYDPDPNRFLVLSTETPLVRYLDLPEPIQPLAVKPPLRVLVMISSPSDHMPLDVEREWTTIGEALGGLEQRELVTLERLEEASLIALQRQLRQSEYHIFHFVGHGSFDEPSQDGLLILEDEQGRGRRVSGQDLGTLLHDHRPLRLAFLNACEGARASQYDPFAGVAQSLVQQGVPAVVAMQREVTDKAAIALVREFYTALAEGYPVDADLAEARKAVFALGDNVEWGTPVLYMRSPDGRIFDIERAPPPSPVRASEGLVALTELMQAPAVQGAAITFRANFQATCEHISALGHLKQLHDSFQELENLYSIVDGERKRLATDHMAWEALMLHEPELQDVIESLLNVATCAASIADNAWWMQQLGQAREELRAAIENFDVGQLDSAARRLSRILDREPSRINIRLVATARALRLTGLVKAMATVQGSLAHLELDLEAVHRFADGVDALAELDDNLTTLVNNHDRWQEINDELRRVEANLDQDLIELELAWPDLNSMTHALCGDSTADWAIVLKEVGAELGQALTTQNPVRIKMLFLRYRSRAGRRLRRVDSDLLTLSQDLQKIGGSLDLLMRTMR
jgi:hypothetical protein